MIAKWFDRLFVDPLNRFLCSRTGLVIALIFPLLVLRMGSEAQKIENILSSNWTQLWALFVLAIIAARNEGHAKEAHHAAKALHKHLKTGEYDD